ncbi:MAG: hypothetical protein Q4B81_00295 [Moraxella sp.]|nr:hypothetical protein [Moraxella sp.]
MAYISISLAENGSMTVANGVAKTPIGTHVAQIHLQHEYDFGSNVSVAITAEQSSSGLADYQSVLSNRMKQATNLNSLNSEQNNAVNAMKDIKGVILSLEFFDRTDGQTLARLRGRLHENGGIEALEEEWGDRPSFTSTHLDYQGILPSQSLFSQIETQLAVTGLYTAAPNATKARAGLMEFIRLNGFNQGYASSKKSVVLNVPNYAHPTTGAFGGNQGAKWQQLIREVAPNYIGTIGADTIGHINALVSVNERTGGHLVIDVGEKTRVDEVVALSTTLGYDNHQIRLVWNPTKSRPSDGSSIRKTWRPCVGDYIAKHIVRNQLRDANGIPPLHIPVGGYDFPVNLAGIEYLDDFTLSDEEQEDLAAAHVIMVINERFNRESRWIYGDVLTQRNSKTSALRLSNAAEIETFTARGIIEISKRYLLSNMRDYRNKAMSDGARFLDNCVAAGLLEPAEQLGGLYYSLSIEPREDKPFEAVDIKLARRATGAVRQAYLETTINK